MTTTNHPKQTDTMEGKKDTINEINKVLYGEVKRLGIVIEGEVSYERHWGEKMNYLCDNLSHYRFGFNPRVYETTMSPKKFMSMTDENKKDFIKFISTL